MNRPIYVIIGLQQKHREDSQILIDDTLCRLLVTSVQCFIGTGKYPDAGIILNYDDDYYSQGHGLIKNVFRALTKDDILQPYTSDHDFRSSNVGAEDVG